MADLSILEAIEVAAGAGDLNLNPTFRSGAHANVGRKRIFATRQTILRFLQNVPDDMTAMDMRRAIEGEEERDDG
jgi:hypothetical protein